jgi:transcription elongation factor Elf1
MYPSGERAQCLRQVKLHKRFACHICGSASFIIRDARFSTMEWSTMESPTLEVDLRCAKCGTTDTVSLSLVEARRCGFDEPASA